MVVSCGYFERELRQCSKEKGVTLAESVETLGVHLRTKVKRLGAKKIKKKCRARFSPIGKINDFQKNSHPDCVKLCQEWAWYQ